MMSDEISGLPPYRHSIAGLLLAAREATMAPIRPELRAADVTEQQWRVLRVLSDEGPLDIATLATSAMLHGPSVTRILKELGERDLIARDVDPQDKRRSIIAITDVGRALVSRTAEHTRLLVQGYQEAFGKERLGLLMKELSAFHAALQQFAPDEQNRDQSAAAGRGKD
ncbi:Homoprotocatechuate degradative operon repressor [hydrothermal vent metagenome]|uniref:Homoprotocatechuate degradative operon repressor n=1 Tax=hydrothermal vent metagenome TaxID=652676 RepID=A0A161K5F5_9ZZZZ